MIKIIISNIQYDLSHLGHYQKRKVKKLLPKTLVTTLDYDYDEVMQDQEKSICLYDIEDDVSDYISNTTNLFHLGFNYTIEKH